MQLLQKNWFFSALVVVVYAATATTTVSVVIGDFGNRAKRGRDERNGKKEQNE